MTKPIKDQTFECKQCGMALKVVTECNCKDCSPKLECCGKPMAMK